MGVRRSRKIYCYSYSKVSAIRSRSRPLPGLETDTSDLRGKAPSYKVSQVLKPSTMSKYDAVMLHFKSSQVDVQTKKEGIEVTCCIFTSDVS